MNNNDVICFNCNSEEVLMEYNGDFYCNKCVLKILGYGEMDTKKAEKTVRRLIGLAPVKIN